MKKAKKNTKDASPAIEKPETVKNAPESNSKNNQSSNTGPKKFQNNNKIQKKFPQKGNNSKKPSRPHQDTPQYEVFVGAIPFATTEKELLEHFSSCGEVLGAKLLQNHEGKSKGRGFVKFATKESVGMAVKLNGTMFGGQQLKVDEVRVYDELFKEKDARKEERSIKKMQEISQSAKKHEVIESSTVCVRNLDFAVTDTVFFEAFKGVDGFVSCRMIKNEMGKNRGFGFVQFNDIQTAKKALSLNGNLLLRNKMFLEFSAPRIQREHKGKTAEAVVSEFRGNIVEI